MADCRKTGFLIFGIGIKLLNNAFTCVNYCLQNSFRQLWSLREGKDGVTMDTV